MRTDARLALLLAVLTLLPQATAASEGALWSEGPLVLRSGSSVQGEVTTLLWNFVTRTDAFEIHARRALVTAVDHTVIITSNGLIIPIEPEQRRRWELTDLTLRNAGLSEGRIIVRSDAGASTASWSPEGWVELAPTTAEDPRPFVEDRILFDDGTSPYLAWRGDEAVTVEGDMWLEPAHMVLDVDARENRTRVDTSPRDERRPVPGGPVIARRTILSFELEGAVARIDADVEGVGSFRRVWAEEALSCRLSEASGFLAGERLDEETLSLEGHFLVDATVESRGDAVGALTFLRGDIVGIGAVEAPTRASAKPSWPLLAGIVLAAAAAAAFWVSRRRRGGTWDAEQYAQLADAAAETGDHETALRWTREALRIAPTSVRLRQDEAFFLERLGEREAALAVYASLAAAHGDAESEYRAARIVAQAEGEASEVVARLCRALARDPSIAEALLDDPVLARYADVSPLREALDASVP